MELNLSGILFIISLITMAIYQFSSFSYASKLLVGGSTNRWVYLFLAIINTSVFAVVQLLNIPFYLVVLCMLVALFIEFKLVSKADFVQVFCGASIFVLHLAALLTPFIVIVSHVADITPMELVDNTIYDHIIVIVSCIILIFAHELVKKYINNSSIQRVTVKSRHSIILLTSILLIVILQINHIYVVIADILYPEQILLSLAVSFASLLIFYLFFLYAINLIDASRYKRYSDQVLSEQEGILKKKETLITKIEKDELTGVFNRRYAMSALEEMCEDTSNPTPFYVLFVDINALKYTNDTYGHKAGDRLIIKVAHAILTSSRENDIVARIGGDEILVILVDIQGEECGCIVERINKCIEIQNATEDFLVSASIGTVYVDEAVRKQGASHILSVADENMRKNKELFYKKRGEGSVC